MKNLLKIFITIILQVILLACSSTNSQRISPAFNNALNTIQGALFGYPDPLFTREIINNIPYASAILKIGKGSSGLIILESVSSAKSTWVSKDNIFIVIEGGRIIQTEGLVNNLTSFVRPDISFKEFIDNPTSFTSFFVYYSYDEPFLSNLKVEISLIKKGYQEIEILGKTRNLLLIEETLSNEQIRWKKKNLYWVDPSDFFVWKSIQHISPKLPPFVLQITKRPSV